MQFRFTCLAAVVIATTVGLGAQPPASTAAAMFEAARKMDVIDGDLEGAIRQYQAIADRFGSDRQITANALIRLADAYERLGNARARTIYQRLAREFGDQPAGVTARAKLGTEPSTATASGDRALWTGRDVDLFGTISPDGRYLTYTDWDKTNNIMVRDFATGTSRALTNNTKFGEFGYSDWSAISRDGEQVIFGFSPAEAPHELRLASLRGTGVPTSRRVVQSPMGTVLRPFDWSPDGKSVVVLVERQNDASQLGVLSVASGELRPLKTIDWRGASKAVFSPDGRFIAYDLSMTDTRKVAHIFVMAADASSEVPLVTDNSRNLLMGWAADGHLLFASDRSGSLDLWALSVADGRSRQAATLVKSGIGSAVSLGLSTSNTLYVWQRASPMSVQVAGLDEKTGSVDLSQPEFRQFVDSRGRPTWSVDGKQLLFISCGGPGGGPCRLFIRNNDSRAVNDVPHRLGYVGFPRFSPDGSSIVTDGTDLKGRSGIYVIRLADGDTRMLARRDALRRRNPQWSRDGKGIFWTLSRDGATVLARHELATGDEMDVFRSTLSGVQNFRVSPDETHVAYIQDDSAGMQSLMVSPIEGGPARTLFTARPPDSFSFQWQWRTDSRALYISRLNFTSGVGGLWTVPLDDAPRRLDVDASKWVDGNLFSVDPSGRKIAYVTFAGQAGAEVWALEHVLPAARSTGSRRR